MNFGVIAYVAAVIALAAGIIYAVGLQTLPDKFAVEVRQSDDDKARQQVSADFEQSFSVNEPKARIVVLSFMKKTAFYISGLAFFCIVLNFAFNAGATGMLLPGLIAAAGFGLGQNWYLFPLILFGVYFVLNSQRMV